MNVLVTGASGFIGSALVDRLLRDGHSVRALLHQKTSAALDSRVRYVTADLTDPSSLPAAVSDIDVIFHCAALVKDYGSKKEILKVNLQGTKNLIEACENKVHRFIFLSHLHSKSTRNAGAYSSSKALAEQYLIKKYQKEKFPVVIIRPGNVYVPGATTWVLLPLRAIQQGRIRLIDKGNGIFLHAYIDNLIDALAASIDAPTAVGEIIEVTDGDNTTTWGTYLNDLAAITGKKPITRNMTKTTALLLSKLMMTRYYLFGTDPLVTPTAVHLLTNRRTVSIQKAETLLGYKPTIEYAEGMRRTKTWLKTERYL
jgi:nucleoside-diphosphate-sugar epimerase